MAVRQCKRDGIGRLMYELLCSAADLYSGQRTHLGGGQDGVTMAKRPGSNPKSEWAFFDVVYEDGTQRSNRRVPIALLGGPDDDAPARDYIIEQDREIAAKSGQPALEISTIVRVGAKPPKYPKPR